MSHIHFSVLSLNPNILQKASSSPGQPASLTPFTRRLQIKLSQANTTPRFLKTCLQGRGSHAFLSDQATTTLLRCCCCKVGVSLAVSPCTSRVLSSLCSAVISSLLKEVGGRTRSAGDGQSSVAPVLGDGSAQLLRHPPPPPLLPRSAPPWLPGKCCWGLGGSVGSWTCTPLSHKPGAAPSTLQRRELLQQVSG